ncbi:hypothetical protein, partial [Acinetobacter bereziniae]|uniref:hypothetical protein n=1 Tax=Acinetobacter bereziniae TaxID=106648 RepID=UPI001C06D956
VNNNDLNYNLAMFQHQNITKTKKNQTQHFITISLFAEKYIINTQLDQYKLINTTFQLHLHKIYKTNNYKIKKINFT